MQRERYDADVTQVRKAPLIYLVVVCLVYSVFGMVMTVMALYLRRTPEVREQQARLMVEWVPEVHEGEYTRDKAGQKWMSLHTEPSERLTNRVKKGIEVELSSIMPYRRLLQKIIRFSFGRGLCSARLVLFPLLSKFQNHCIVSF